MRIPPRLLELLKFTADEKGFLLRHRFELTGVAHALVVLHLRDALRHGLEVGEHAAEPTLVHIRHAATLGVTTNRVLGLLLCAHKHDRAAVGHEIADEAVRGFDATKGLLEIDDVNAIALTVDESLHLRVPAAGLMTKMHAGIEQLAHGDNWCHEGVPSHRFGGSQGRAGVSQYGRRPWGARLRMCRGMSIG